MCPPELGSLNRKMIFIQTHIYVCIPRIYVYVCIHIYICVYTHTHMCINTCIYTYIDVYTHTQTYTHLF